MGTDLGWDGPEEDWLEQFLKLQVGDRVDTFKGWVKIVGHRSCNGCGRLYPVMSGIKRMFCSAGCRSASTRRKLARQQEVRAVQREALELLVELTPIVPPHIGARLRAKWERVVSRSRALEESGPKEARE